MKVTIEWTYKTKNGIETIFRSDELAPAHALTIAEDLKNTGRAKNITFIDQQDSTWLEKELKKYIKEIDTEPHHVKVYFDGGYDLQRKESGLGVAIYYEQNGKPYRLRRNALVSSLNSNNEAEYAALHLALIELDLLGVHHQMIQIYGDSQVVINQMNGEWPAYEKELANWADRIDEKLRELGITVEYELIPRKANEETDRLATQALKGIEITGQIELNQSN